jgi:serine/threonine protein kinase
MHTHIGQITLLQAAENNTNDTFNTLWRNNAAWFETPNIRRGGWSGVVRCAVDIFGQHEIVFIKRQESHMTKSLFHPIKGIPTFLREYRNIQLLQARNISTLEVLYFGTKASKAILVTKALEGYTSLDKIDFSTLNLQDKKALIVATARVIQHLHQYHYQHSCLYPKHIMVCFKDHQWNVKLIDLEKLKFRLFKKDAVIRDLTTFFRHTNGMLTMRERVMFFHAYFSQPKISTTSKKLIHTICKKVLQKANTKKESMKSL